MPQKPIKQPMRHSWSRYRQKQFKRIRSAKSVRTLAKSLLEQDPTCCYCGRDLNEDSMTIEHLTPLSRGGTNDPENIEIACKRCNGTKGDQTLQEMIAKRRGTGIVEVKNLKKVIAAKIYAGEPVSVDVLLAEAAKRNIVIPRKMTEVAMNHCLDYHANRAAGDWDRAKLKLHMIQPLIDLIEKYQPGQIGPVNSWLRLEAFDMTLYARRTTRYIRGEKVETVDLASVEIDEEAREQGQFKRFLFLLESYCKQHNLTVYVESVLVPYLADFLLKRGYKIVEKEEDILALHPTEAGLSYYKHFNADQNQNGSQH